MATNHPEQWADGQQKILVLLYSFTESEESILGFKFCQELLRRGHHLLVTTTTPRNQIWWDKNLARQHGGRVTLMQPEHEEDETPTPDWIGKYHRTYYPKLTRRTDIKCIVGMLPGTTNTGIHLKEDLKCKLVLLATSKLHFDQYEFHLEVDKLESADEIWSIGPDMFNHFEETFKGAGGTVWSKHRMFLLQPEVQERESNKPSGLSTLISVWRHGYPYLYKGRRAISKGSSRDNFVAVGAAIGRINEAKGLTREPRLHWLVHALKEQKHVIFGIEQQGQGYTNDLIARKDPKTQDEVRLQGPSALIVPDRTEDSFNFTALAALWQGVPTIVSDESSIGKLLHMTMADCPVVDRALIRLTGDVMTDRVTWLEKIYNDLLNDDARPFEWAGELREYLHDQTEMWQSDFSVFNTPPLNTAVLDPLQLHQAGARVIIYSSQITLRQLFSNCDTHQRN